MRIDNNGPKQVAQHDVASSERVQSGKPGQGTTAPAGRADRVQVSPDALLVTSAVKSASESPEIRPEAVARAKAKLAAGEIGNDPERLADRIIDDLLES